MPLPTDNFPALDDVGRILLDAEGRRLYKPAEYSVDVDDHVTVEPTAECGCCEEVATCEDCQNLDEFSVAQPYLDCPSQYKFIVDDGDYAGEYILDRNDGPGGVLGWFYNDGFLTIGITCVPDGDGGYVWQIHIVNSPFPLFSADYITYGDFSLSCCPPDGTEDNGWAYVPGSGEGVPWTGWSLEAVL